MSEVELLDCPFCGSKADVLGEHVFHRDERLVCCWGKDENCPHRGVMMNEKAWNTRTPQTPDPRDEKIARYEEVLRRNIETFEAVMNNFGLPLKLERIGNIAICKTSIEETEQALNGDKE